MARNFGTFNVSANYEPTIGLPFDARQLVAFKEDLINPATWTNGNKYLYNGMFVSVGKDTEENNGLYILKNRLNYTSYDAWVKIADAREVAALQAQIDNLQPQQKEIQFKTKFDLPNVGDVGTIYVVTSENASYYWNVETATYICCGRDYHEIQEIHGGNAE
jgi:hypothetical protein